MWWRQDPIVNLQPPAAARHIELNRQFRQESSAIDPERAELEAFAAEAAGRSSDLDWGDLLKQHRVVVLGEPGSGKTEEFRHKADELRTQGEYAFFVQLDQLVFGSLESSLGRHETKLLHRWVQSREEAVFFLDSVDESKLRLQSDFFTALDRLGDGIREGLARARIIISSRFSEWRAETDAWGMMSRLPVPPTDRPGNDRATDLLIVQLVPLDKARVRLFAQAKGVDDPDAFFQELDAAHAWPFARRPFDVLALIKYWRRYGAFGSLRDLIELDLEEKLRETDDRAKLDPLSREQARTGAMALAAAVAFCRSFDFAVPDDRKLGGEDAMGAAECLPGDWPSDHQSAILNRAVFDSASFRRVRFHHRRVAEYLAAEWLNERMAQGCELETLDQLLFESGSGRRILRPFLAPVTAWLACGDEEWNSFTRQWILEADPTLFLRHGDPDSLPVDYRKTLLRKLVERYRGRQRVWIEDETESLARIAHPDLAPVIRELATDRGVSNDVREILLQVVRHGRISACVDVALNIIADPNEADSLKQYAVAAVRDAGEQKHKQRLVSIVSQWPHISSSLCGIVCEAVYPDTVSVDGLMDLLSKVEGVPDSGIDLPWTLAHHLESSLPEDDQVAVLMGLIDLARLPPHVLFGEKETPISARFSWAGDVAASLVESMLNGDRLDTDAVSAIADALALLLPRRHLVELRNLHEDAILEGLARHPEVRREFVWTRVADLRAAELTGKPDIWEVFGFGGKIGPELSDLEWLCPAIQHREPPEEQRLALSMAVDVWSYAGRPWKWRQSIRRAARHLSEPEIETTQLRRWLGFQLTRHWHQRIGRTVGNRSWRKTRRRKIRERLDHWRTQITLMRQRGGLSSGENTPWLASLASEASIRDSLSRKRTAYSGDWSSLEERRNRVVANAVKTGCKRAWRRYQPLLPHETAQRDHRIIVGLSGIAAAIDDGGLEIDSMSREDARLATRYAVHELNGFPAWFFELARAQQAPVAEVLSECLFGEWRLPNKEGNVHEVLAAIRWYGNPQLHFIADTLLEMLTKCDPLHPAVLENALAIMLQLSDPPRTVLAKLAAARSARYNVDERHWSLWFLIWMQTDSVAALDHMEELLDRTNGGGALMEHVCGSLSGQHTLAPLLLNDPDYLSPASLRRLIPLAFKYLRPEDDIERPSGVVYSPSARDGAEFFRGRLISLLAASDHPDAGRVLQELMAKQELEHLRDWILHLAEERRTRIADLPPWQPEKIREFTKDYETDPRNHHELFEIGRRRLADIKFSVEADECSPRSDFRSDDKERRLRKWLKRQLDARAKGRYGVTQEEEIDPLRNPDLRLVRQGIAAVPIEVKWADHWTGPKLFERLENQLIGDYLRPHDAHCGFYVLGNKGTKQNWQHPEDRRRLAFGVLVDAVQARADAITSSRPDIHAVAVVGIDFSQ